MYELLERLMKRHERHSDLHAPGNEIALDDGAKCWTSHCILSGSAEQAPMHIPFIELLEQHLGFPATRADEKCALRLGEEYVERMRRWLLEELQVNLDSVDDMKARYLWRRQDKTNRIGFPMHLRILRDTTAGPSRGRPRWNPEGRAIAGAWGIESSDGAWLWRRLFDPASARTIERASTRTIAIADSESSPGAQGFSNILTIAVVPWLEDETPKHGFVRHPKSFGYCLEEDFRDALSSSHHYLQQIGLWPEGVVLEWNLEMKNRVPVLTGGSAGAAFALAAGSLLARLRQRENAPA